MLLNIFNRDNTNQIGFHLVCCLLWVYCFASVIFQPMLNDCMVFWSWAQQIHMSDLSGMDAIQSVCEIKGLLSRIWYYQLYSITSIFSFDIYPYGQYLFHFVGITEFCCIVGLAIWLVPSNVMNKIEKYWSFYVISISVFTLTPMANLQPEIIGLAVVIISFSLLLRDSLTYQLIGGVLCGLLFFIKSPMILLAGSVFFSYSIIKESNFSETIQRTWLYIVTAIITVTACIGVIYHYFPQEIQDIQDAAFFQSTLIHIGPAQAFRTLKEGFSVMWKMPVFLPIISIGLISLCICLVNRDKRLVFNLLAVWLFPFLYVIISNCYYQYHFVTFLFPSFLSILLAKDYWKGTVQNRKLCLAMILTVIIGLLCTHYKCYFLFRQVSVLFFLFPVLCMFLSMSERYRLKSGTSIILFLTFLIISHNSLLSHSYRESQKEIDESLKINAAMGYKINDSLGEGPILRLDAGVSPIWLNNKSYLRYFYPLPIQRTEESSLFSKSRTFVDTKNMLLKYNGEYIILDSTWFFGCPHKEVSEWIDKNYECIGSLFITANNGYGLYMRHPAVNVPLGILKRKSYE